MAKAKAKGEKPVSFERKLAQISRRIYELEQNHYSEIKKNNFVRVAAGIVFPEMRWLVDELRKAKNLDPLPAVRLPQIDAEEDDDDAADEGEGEPKE